ncbi:hypothetical protein [Vibrio pacinii]|uniref:hypothetical protein n=1 Tax=Vibrio pacinii TaxID=170674 RepID=UPI000570AD57|nr:hypothetical protein [Vibrio pacinii]
MKFIFTLLYFIYNNAYAVDNFRLESDIGIMSHKYGTLIVAYNNNYRIQLQEPYYLDPYYLEHSTWNPKLTHEGIILYNKAKKSCIKYEGARVPYASTCDINNLGNVDNLDSYTFRRIPSTQGSFLLQFKNTELCLFARWVGSLYYPFVVTCPKLNDDVDMGFLWSFVPKVGHSFAAQPLSIN